MADPYDRDLMVRSLEGALWMQALIYEHLATATIAELGPGEGRDRLSAGLEAYGRWRGEHFARQLPPGATARDVAEHWPGADLRLALEQGCPGGGFRPGGGVAEISLVDAPEWREWRDHLSDRSLARVYYTAMLQGFAAGFGRDIVIEHPKYGPDLKSLWTVRFTMPGDAGRGPLESDSLADRTPAMALLMQTNRNFAALYTFLARAVMAGPSLSGEKAIRSGTRAFGVDRGERLKARHVAEGKPINMRTVELDYDLPAISVWGYRHDETVLTDTRLDLTCTFCPFAQVWDELDANDIGWMYDYEFHVAQYQAYLPGMIVEFDGVKTLGSATCKFRFRMPEGAVVEPTRQAP